MKSYTAIGLMSGTSHDGLDIAHCTFIHERGGWAFKINLAETIPYPEAWRQRLLTLPQKEEKYIRIADDELGKYIGKTVKDFIDRNGINADLIASHGHTIFHDPAQKYTLQIGRGEHIASISRMKVINDFRSSDLKLGGQGAPLVPIGDRMLFGDYDYCLNIGGIANISYEEGGQRLAFDICPANMVLNSLSAQIGKEYDNEGMMAAMGSIIEPLLRQLESLPYYKLSGPRSLGREWVEESIFPLLKQYQDEPLNDLLATFTEHAALRTASIIGNDNSRVLITGGGAYNNFLIKRTGQHCQADLIIPEPAIVEFKEALIFAFLGVLRDRGDNNVLGSVTGAGVDHSAGSIHIP